MLPPVDDDPARVPAPADGAPTPGALVALVADARHGPLPALLLSLTVVTGLVDAVSILALGRVFVANMTGNVVFVGFALAGIPGFSLRASLFALAGFLVGALGGGALILRTPSDRAVLLLRTVLIELVLLGAALLLAEVGSRPYSHGWTDGIAALTAISMGLQTASVRRLAVPDLSTTVLTMTLTGLASEIRARNRAALSRRILAVVAMLIGAVVGALLVDDVQPSAALATAVGLMTVVTIGALLARRDNQASDGTAGAPRSGVAGGGWRSVP